MSADPFLTTWGLFRALETETACEGTGLPDPTVDGLYEAALAEIGGDGLDAGWHLVAARLRQALVEHAQELDCDCGSAAWVEREQFARAEGPMEDE
jgi:hypothetical protein